MLSPSTLQHLGHYTCPHCQQPLGRFHAYPLLQAAQVISFTSDLAPMHRMCAEEHQQQLLQAQPPDQLTRLSVIAVVKASPRSPSARIIRLHPADATTTTLHLFTPDTIHFLHQELAHQPAAAAADLAAPVSALVLKTRPATNAEVLEWMAPAIEKAALKANGNPEEIQELTLTLGRLQKLHINPAAEKATRQSHPLPQL